MDCLPLYLTENQIADPKQVITDFFADYPIKRIRYLLSDWLDAGISHECSYYDKGYERSNLFWLHEHLLCPVEAAYQLRSG